MRTMTETWEEQKASINAANIKEAKRAIRTHKGKISVRMAGPLEMVFIDISKAQAMDAVVRTAEVNEMCASIGRHGGLYLSFQHTWESIDEYYEEQYLEAKPAAAGPAGTGSRR